MKSYSYNRHLQEIQKIATLRKGLGLPPAKRRFQGWSAERSAMGVLARWIRWLENEARQRNKQGRG